jgi:exopolyphosphatase / guanosine-5'-triphosphate,3'-diphosphate pyrophosphatase
VARVAAIDIGTNSVLLLAVEETAEGSAVLADRAVVTRLGEGVDRTRQLSSGGRQRTLGCLEAYAEELRELGVECVSVVGTSALRDTADAGSFCAEVRALLGSEPLVLGGEEEARLSFEGALSGLTLAGPIALCDPGGGSTELVYGSIASDVAAIDTLHSLELGAVRLHERHLCHDPPTPIELRELGLAVRAALAALPLPPARVTWVCVGGTVTTLAAIELGLVRYRAERVHGMRFVAARIHELAERLARLPIEGRRTIAGLDPARADVIVAGAMLLCELLSWARVSELVVSDRGVRWGLVHRLLRTRGLSPPKA